MHLILKKTAPVWSFLIDAVALCFPQRQLHRRAAAVEQDIRRSPTDRDVKGLGLGKIGRAGFAACLDTPVGRVRADAGDALQLLADGPVDFDRLDVDKLYSS